MSHNSHQLGACLNMRSLDYDLILKGSCVIRKMQLEDICNKDRRLSAGHHPALIHVNKGTVRCGKTATASQPKKQVENVPSPITQFA